MNKKLSKLAAAVSLIALGVCMTACGSNSEKALETISETVSETVETQTTEETVREETTPEETKTQETQETAEETAIFDQQSAEAKFFKLFDAREDLFSNAIESNNLPILDYYFLTETLSYIIDKDSYNIQLKDGTQLVGGTTPNSYYMIPVLKYFYNYVNNDSGYYDIKEWLEAQTKEEMDTLRSEFFYSYTYTDSETNDFIMYEAVGTLKVFIENNIENVSVGELRAGDECEVIYLNSVTGEYEVSGIPIYYELPILLNGEYSDATAVFDEEGNLLNILTDWDSDVYIDSYDEIMSRLNK
jgi:hypothetical protein